MREWRNYKKSSRRLDRGSMVRLPRRKSGRRPGANHFAAASVCAAPGAGHLVVLQAPPTSAPGVVSYLRKGYRIGILPVVLVSGGFITGGPIGALLTKMCTEPGLRWGFVSYLLLLLLISFVKRSSSNGSVSESQGPTP